MKFLFSSIVACYALITMAELSWADPPQPPSPSSPSPNLDPAVGPPPVLDIKQIEEAGRLLGGDIALTNDTIVARFAPTPDYDKEIAGLPKGSRPAVFTWERIYRLALLRAGSDQKEGIADFLQFSKYFCADASGTAEKFRDPSAAVLDLLGRLEAIDNAARNLAFHEGMRNLLLERIQGESSGLRQLDVDMVLASMARARQKRADEINQFRDRLDELKVLLGLSPRVEFILQRPSPSAFLAVHDAVAGWNRKPNRSLQELPHIIGSLPDLGDVVVDGQPVLAKFDKNPDSSEELMTRTALLAIKNRKEPNKIQPQGDADVQLELRIRRRLRSLLETKRAYEGEKRSYDLSIRLQDQTFERLFAPPTEVSSSRSPLLKELIEAGNERLKVEDRLVSLWTSFRIERLALYHDLGALPYEDWPSFYADLSPGSAVPRVIEPEPAADDNIPPPVPPEVPGVIEPHGPRA
jgi:hypothetical protein